MSVDFSVSWQGCSGSFEWYAIRPRNGLRLQAQMRPARETTQIVFCSEEQRSQGSEKNVQSCS